MNEMTGKLRGSLVERAAEVFDFGAMLRAPVLDNAETFSRSSISPAHRDGDEERVFVPANDVIPASHAGLVPASTAPQMQPAKDHAEKWIPEQVRGDERGIRGERAVAPLDGKAPVDRELLAANGLLVPGAPVGALAEEFRLVKRHLMATMRSIGADDRARTMLVCSARPNDGKTYCAINLAISLAAERDAEVLLVDADFAKPDVLARLGLPAGPGLLDALADPLLAPEECVIATDVARLSVLPAGTKSIDDTELLASRRTGEVIAALLAENPARIIVFDSPPALAASPASVLANHVGQVMLVVRADRTSEGDVREAVAMLDACEHIQLVLNAVSYAPSGRRFGSYYGREEAA